jgi:hypothetical protein
MIAVPGATPTTTPAGETVAFAESDVVQTKLRCMGAPDASVAVAVSWSVAVGVSVAVSAEITTVAGVGEDGPRTLSLPAQERMSQPRTTDPAKR